MGKYDRDHQAGRADAAAGRYRPPTPNILNTERTCREKEVRREHYKEGYYDKKRQMGR
jgi:hypothetical protein